MRFRTIERGQTVSEIYIEWAANDVNRIAEVGEAMQLPDVVGIVDEAEGGVIAYAPDEHAERIVKALRLARELDRLMEVC